MKMEATYSSETSVAYQQTTRRYIPEENLFIVIMVRNSVPGSCICFFFCAQFRQGRFQSVLLEVVQMALGAPTEVSEACALSHLQQYSNPGAPVSYSLFLILFCQFFRTHGRI
jgi:hypothetical protein